MSDTPGAELARVAAPSIMQRRRTEYDPGQLDLIKATVMHEDANDAELAMFLELCARYELDPFARQVWSIKVKRKVQTVVSHAGLLSLAERHTPAGMYRVVGPGQYLGTIGDVVHEHDYFEKYEDERDDGTTKVVVEHRYRDAEGKPVHGSHQGRGEIVGAWGRVRRFGFDDRYFWARQDEYDRGENTWKSHPHFMMLKCAQTVALRLAFSVSGVVGAEEVGQRGPDDRITVANGVDGNGDIQWPDDDELAESARHAFDAAGWPRAKQRLHINGKTPEEIRAAIQRASDEVDMAAAEDEEPVADAEVVE